MPPKKSKKIAKPTPSPQDDDEPIFTNTDGKSLEIYLHPDVPDNIKNILVQNGAKIRKKLAGPYSPDVM